MSNELMKRLMQRFATPLASKLDGQELRTVLFVAISFHFIYVGYRAIQNLQSSLNEEDGLGVISLGVLYGAWIFSGILTPTLIRLLTTKGTLLLAWIFHIFYVIASFLPTSQVLLPASLLVGAMSAPLWTSQSLYMTACGFSHAKHAASSPYDIFSRFNGIFYAIYETSQITGNLVSSLVLHNGMSERNDSDVLEDLHCGREDCPHSVHSRDFEEPKVWARNVLMGIYVACCVIGTVVTYFFVLPLPKSEWTMAKSMKEVVTSFFVTLRRTSIGWLVPLFIFQGMQQAILYSEFTRSYISCPWGISMVGYVMAAHGATTPIVTLIFSRVVKYTGRYLLFMLAGIINLGLMVLMFYWTPSDHDQAYVFLVPIAWGFSESIWMTQSNSIVAVQFPEQKEPAFAIYHTSRSVGLTFTFAYSSFLCATVKLLIGMGVVVVALVFYTVSEVRLLRQAKRQNKANAGPEDNGPVWSLASKLMEMRTDHTLQVPEPPSSPDVPPVIQRPVETPHQLETQVSVVSDGNEWIDTFPPDPQLSPTGHPLTGMLPRIPSMASSSSSILSSLTLMARYSENDDDLTPPCVYSRYQLSGSVAEESVF